MKANKTIIVAFKIGRGGQYYNAGHLSYIGERRISEFTDSLFLKHEELLNFKKRDGFEEIAELAGEGKFKELEERFGIEECELGERVYFTDGGHAVGLTEDECDEGVGGIEIDGDYDTTYCCCIEECNEKELELIRNYDGYKSAEVEAFLELLKETENLPWDKNVLSTALIPGNRYHWVDRNFTTYITGTFVKWDLSEDGCRWGGYFINLIRYNGKGEVLEMLENHFYNPDTFFA